MPLPKQVELEDYIAKKAQRELADAFTGELFQPRARNHYEDNDGIPVAPAVDMPRPTIRQRVENLINRGIDPLSAYVGTEGIDMDIPDDPDAPITPSEANYIDAISESLAEQAPLPDEGLPRPAQAEPLVSPTPPHAQNAAPAGVASPQQAPSPQPAAAPVLSR